MTATAASHACPYCLTGVEDSVTTPCPTCGGEHHTDCWYDNGGCAVHGCAGAPTASVSQAPVSQAPVSQPPVVPAVPAQPAFAAPPVPQPPAWTPYPSQQAWTPQPSQQAWTPYPSQQAWTPQPSQQGHNPYQPPVGPPRYGVNPYGYAGPATTPTNGYGIAALVVGLVGLLLAGIVAGPVAIVLGAVGIGRSRELGTGRGMSQAGLVLGVIDTVFALALLSA